MKTYDVLVLGGGTAGTSAARAARKAGASVAMFNDGELGGLCILRGCMPTKTMLHAAHLRHEAEHHRTPGIAHESLAADFAEVMRNKDAKVARFKHAKIAGIEKGGYDVIDAYAKFAGQDRVEADGQLYRFTKGAVIATGSVVNVPPIPGVEDVPYWTSDDVMALTERPDSVIVIGSGAITVVDPGHLKYSSMGKVRNAEAVTLIGINLHILAHGARYDANTRIACAENDHSIMEE